MWLLQPLVLLVALSAISGSAQDYFLQSFFSGPSFFNNFNFWNVGDPTFGYVHYLDRGDAEALGLINYTNPDTARWGVDTTRYLDPDANLGRPSLRLTSVQDWTHGLFILDLAHMPANVCGVWPAFWTVGTGVWPTTGEIDIIEFQNNLQDNIVAMHTSSSPNCSIAGSDQLGTLLTSDCASANSYTGCGSSVNELNNMGSSFNANGGGVYAMEWTSNAVKIWFFPRGQVPESITQATGTQGPDPRSFGKLPEANFQGSCDLDAHLSAQNLVFNIDFCGSFAGNTWQGDDCPMLDPANVWRSCNMYVAANPQAYTEVYWEVNYLKIFQTVPGAAVATPISLSSVVPAVSTSSIPSVSGNAEGRSSTPTMPFPINPTLMTTTISPLSTLATTSDTSQETAVVVVVTETITVSDADGEQIVRLETVTHHVSDDHPAASPRLADPTPVTGTATADTFTFCTSCADVDDVSIFAHQEIPRSMWDGHAPDHYPKAPLPLPLPPYDPTTPSPRARLAAHLPQDTGNIQKRHAEPQVLSGGDFNWCGTPGSSCSHKKLVYENGNNETKILVAQERSVHEESSVTRIRRAATVTTHSVTELSPIEPLLGSEDPFLEPGLPTVSTMSDLEAMPKIFSDEDLATVYVVVTYSYTVPSYTHQMFTYDPLAKRDETPEPQSTEMVKTVPDYTHTLSSYQPEFSDYTIISRSVATEMSTAPELDKRNKMSPTDEGPTDEGHASKTATVSTIPVPPHTCTPVVLVQSDGIQTPVGCAGLQEEDVPKLQHISAASTTETIFGTLPTEFFRVGAGPGVPVSELLDEEAVESGGASSLSCGVALRILCGFGVVGLLL